MKRILKILGLFLGAFLLLAIAAAYREMLIAESFLSDMKKLRVGSSSFSEVQDILKKYKRYQAGVGGDKDNTSGFVIVGSPCTSDNCGAGIVFYNIPIAYLMLAPPLEFSTDLSVNKGHLSNVSMTILTKKLGREIGVQLIESEENSTQSKDVIVQPVQGVRKGTQVDGEKFFLNPNAKPESRDRAYAFNVGCLARMLGCKTIEQIHPLARP